MKLEFCIFNTQLRPSKFAHVILCMMYRHYVNKIKCKKYIYVSENGTQIIIIIFFQIQNEIRYIIIIIFFVFMHYSLIIEGWFHCSIRCIYQSSSTWSYIWKTILSILFIHDWKIFLRLIFITFETLLPFNAIAMQIIHLCWIIIMFFVWL